MSRGRHSVEGKAESDLVFAQTDKSGTIMRYAQTGCATCRSPSTVTPLGGRL